MGVMPGYIFSPLNELEAREILSWRYPGVPTLYVPDPEHLDEDLQALLDPAFHYHIVREASEKIVGFCCFGEDAQVPGGDYSLSALDIGLGMNPHLVGQGLSRGFLQAVLTWARKRFQPDFFRATVAALNVRSLSMFARAGFLTTQRFRSDLGESVEFLILIRVVEEAIE